METPAFGNERAYLDSILGLVDTSTTFLNDMKAKNVKKMSITAENRLDTVLLKVKNADVGYVSNMEFNLSKLNEEFIKLMKKFHIFKREYTKDVTLKDFLGDHRQDQTATFSKLSNFIDGSINQIDTVVTSYSSVLRELNKPKQWISTVLTHHYEDKVAEKARTSNQIVKDLEFLINDIRRLCQNAKYDLVQLRTSTAKYIPHPKDITGKL